MLKQKIFLKDYDKNIELSYIMYLDANNLYGWAMPQNLAVNAFKWVKQKTLSKFNEDFIKNYDENSNKGYFLEVDIDYPKELFNLYKDLPFLPERKKSKICYTTKAMFILINKLPFHTGNFVKLQ